MMYEDVERQLDRIEDKGNQIWYELQALMDMVCNYTSGQYRNQVELDHPEGYITDKDLEDKENELTAILQILLQLRMGV